MSLKCVLLWLYVHIQQTKNKTGCGIGHRFKTHVTFITQQYIFISNMTINLLSKKALKCTGINIDSTIYFVTFSFCFYITRLLEGVYQGTVRTTLCCLTEGFYCALQAKLQVFKPIRLKYSCSNL